MCTSNVVIKNVVNVGPVVICNHEFVEEEIVVRGEQHIRTSLNIDVRPYKKLQNLCPICLNKCSIYDNQRHISSWRAPNLNGIIVRLKYLPNRIICPEHGILTEYIPWSDGTSRFTPDFNNEVTWNALYTNKSAISTAFSINWRTVGNCIKAAHSRIEPDRSKRFENLRKICVDETAIQKGHKYIFVVYNMETNTVVWIGENTGYSVFEEFAKLLTLEQRNNIELIAGDGARWIDTCTHDYFPNATRCIDPFHVVQWTVDALDDLRKETVNRAQIEYESMKRKFQEEKAEINSVIEITQIEINTLETENAKLEENNVQLRNAYGTASKKQSAEIKKRLESNARKIAINDDKIESNKKYIEALNNALNDESNDGMKDLSESEKLTEVQENHLKEIQQRYDSIKHSKYALGKNPENLTANQMDKVDILKEEDNNLYKGYQLKEHLRCVLHMSDPEGAAIELKRWISEAQESGIKQFTELAGKIERHEKAIINSVRFKANSAKSESCNTTIKFLIRSARGFRKFENLESLVYLKCSNLEIPLRNRIFVSKNNTA